MTMHLEGPWLSMSGKKRGKVKFRNAEEARRARELDESWKELLKRQGVEAEQKKQCSCYESTPTGLQIEYPCGSYQYHTHSFSVTLVATPHWHLPKCTQVPRSKALQQCTKATPCRCSPTRRQWRFQGCAVGKRISLQCTYYFEVSKDYTDYIDTYAAGVYSAVGYMGGYVGWQNRLAMNSNRIWCQGPRGGVKIVKDRINYYGGGVYGYITKNNKAMKEFAWAKLSARPLEMR
jgi:hypothetical protein